MKNEETALPPLRLTPLRLRFRSQDLALQHFAGPLWRSGFGLALERNFPGVFPLLYAPQARLGRLYALRPPPTPILPGKSFVLGLNLYGAATEHALACAQALVALGEMGLGRPRGHFVLEQAWVEGAAEPFLDGVKGLTGWPAPISPTHWLERCVTGHQIQIELLTPLCIKNGNHIVLAAPSFTDLTARLHGRIKQLCEAAQEDIPIPKDVMQAQRQAAQTIVLEHHDIRPLTLKHRSSRTGDTAQLEGITGSLTYRGDVGLFSGLFSLGEVLQIGGRTAYGFGCTRTQII